MPTASSHTPKRGTHLAEVLVNERICDGHYRMVLDVSTFPPTRPGQFIQIQCRYPDDLPAPREVDWAPGTGPTFTQPELTDREPLLRRPLSLAGRRDPARGAVELDLIYRTTGTGTHWLATVPPGKAVSLLGPLGNAFPISADKPLAAMVGGGVGIPPMLYLAEALAAAGKTAVAFSGARTANLLPLRLLPNAKVSPQGDPAHCIAEFASVNTDASVATDDGSLGFAGLVSQPLERWLAGQDPQQVVVYTCGPEPMMRAVSEICLSQNVECHCSLERHMACGMGTCQSCVCKIRSDAPEGWSYKLCCTDGPVFPAASILWD